MIGWRGGRFLALILVCVWLVSLFVLSACARPAPSAPPPIEKVVTEEKASATQEKAPPPAEKSSPVPQQPTSPPPQQPAPPSVDIIGFAFSPAAITVPVGASITWTNRDSVTHTVTTRGDLFDSGTIPSGATFSQTLTQVGTFEYYCRFHPTMVATVTVGQGGAAPTGGNVTSDPYEY